MLFGSDNKLGHAPVAGLAYLIVKSLISERQIHPLGQTRRRYLPSLLGDQFVSCYLLKLLQPEPETLSKIQN